MTLDHNNSLPGGFNQINGLATFNYWCNLFFFFSNFLIIDRTYFQINKKILSQLGHNVQKGGLVNTF